GHEHPEHQRPLALGHQRVGEGVKGVPTAVAPVAFASRPVAVMTPRVNGLVVTPRPVEWAIFPPERRARGVAGGSLEKGWKGASTGMAENLLGSRDRFWNGCRDSQLFFTLYWCYKP